MSQEFPVIQLMENVSRKGISLQSRNNIDVMCVIIQVQHMLVSETTGESITLISRTDALCVGMCVAILLL
uniref:Alternative protein ZNF507 n=1 Tax=Homo sapiens TaxID=9606 RepID=L8EAR0_HUMAN|nr:alternative protein ZNF507 [Homo sapiens]